MWVRVLVQIRVIIFRVQLMDSVEVCLIIILCQLMFAPVYPVENIGIDPFAVVEGIRVIIQIGYHADIIGKGVEMNVVNPCEHPNGHFFRFKLCVQLFCLYQGVPIADAVRGKEQVKSNLRMFKGCL